MIEWLSLHRAAILVILIPISILMVVGDCFKLVISCRQIIRVRKMAIIDNKKSFFHKR